jgi:hypothetical protein
MLTLQMQMIYILMSRTLGELVGELMDISN